MSPQEKNNKLACAKFKDSDQPGHMPSLISLHCALSGYLRTQAFFMQTIKTDQTGQIDAQADLSLCCAYMPFCRFCCVLAHIYSNKILFRFNFCI